MKLAALDVGTNTVLMLVVEQIADGRLLTLADLSRITRLGRGVDATGRLDPESAARTLDAIVEFTGKARALGAEKILTAATAALRDARDGAEFIAQVKTRTGIDLNIISGDDEAELSYLSTKKGLNLDPCDRVLIVDIGGGSTELIRSEPGRKLDVVSLQIGSVRLTERLVHHDPPSMREAADLRLATDEALQALGWEFRRRSRASSCTWGSVARDCAFGRGSARRAKEAAGYRAGARRRNLRGRRDSRTNHGTLRADRSNRQRPGHTLGADLARTRSRHFLNRTSTNSPHCQKPARSVLA